jgi:small subunit ribosomal protein S21
MNGVKVRDNEPFEKALKRFSKTCERAGVLSDIKKNRRFEKPSEEKKRKKNSVERKRLRDERIKALRRR